MYSYIIYGSIMFTSTASFILYALLRNKKKKYVWLSLLFFIGIFFLPLLFSFYRKGIGTDYYTYEIIYNNLTKYSVLSYIKNYYQNNETLYEFFFYLMNHIAYLLKNDFRFVLLLSTAIPMTAAFCTIRSFRNHLSPTFAWFLFMCLFYQQTYNILRQTIAVSIVLYSFKYLIQKDIKKYVLGITVAVLFHRSACICILFYFFCEKKYCSQNFKNLLLYSAIFFSPFILPVLFKIAPYIPVINHYFIFYEVQADVHIGIGFMLYILPPLLPMILYKNRILEKLPSYRVLYSVFLLSIPLKFSSYYLLWAGRFADYTMASQILLVPILVKAINNNKKRILISLYYTLWYLFYYVYVYWILNTGHTIPYH